MSHCKVNVVLCRELPKDIRYTQDELDRALIECAENDDLIRVCICLKMGENVNASNHRNILYLASRYGYLDIVRELLKHGNIDLNAPNENGMTALHLASLLGHVNIVHELLKHENIDVNALYEVDGQLSMPPANITPLALFANC